MGPPLRTPQKHAIREQPQPLIQKQRCGMPKARSQATLRSAEPRSANKRFEMKMARSYFRVTWTCNRRWRGSSAESDWDSLMTESCFKIANGGSLLNRPATITNTFIPRPELVVRVLNASSVAETARPITPPTTIARFSESTNEQINQGPQKRADEWRGFASSAFPRCRLPCPAPRIRLTRFTS